MKPIQLFPVVLALLFSGCSLFTEEAESLLKVDNMNEPMIALDATSYSTTGGFAEINVSVDNRSDQPLYLDRPYGELLLLEGQELVLAYSPPIELVGNRPLVEIPAGEQFEFVFLIDNRDESNEDLWLVPMESGTYRIDVQLSTRNRGELINPALRGSQLFELTVR